MIDYLHISLFLNATQFILLMRLETTTGWHWIILILNIFVARARARSAAAVNSVIESIYLCCLLGLYHFDWVFEFLCGLVNIMFGLHDCLLMSIYRWFLYSSKTSFNLLNLSASNSHFSLISCNSWFWLLRLLRISFSLKRSDSSKGLFCFYFRVYIKINYLIWGKGTRSVFLTWMTVSESSLRYAS